MDTATVSPTTDLESHRYNSAFHECGYYRRNLVYLNAGGPGTEILQMLPLIMKQATDNRMHQELEGDAQLFQYGLQQGNWQFRHQLARFLSKEYGEKVTSKQLYETSGSTSGLWMILSLLFQPEMYVFVEDPTYYLALKIFQDFKMKIVPVETDEDGIIVEDLRTKLEQCFPKSTASSSSGSPTHSDHALDPEWKASELDSPCDRHSTVDLATHDNWTKYSENYAMKDDILESSIPNPDSYLTRPPSSSLPTLQTSYLTEASIHPSRSHNSSPCKSETISKPSWLKKNLPLSALVYLIPSFHNPTGASLHAERCQEVVKIAREFSVLVFADEVYHLLHYDDEEFAVRRLFSYDKVEDPDYQGNIISSGSFSKIFGPGVRLGWLEAPEWFVHTMKEKGVFQSGGGLNTYTAGVMCSVIALGLLAQQVNEVRKIYQARMVAASNILRNELPSDCRLVSPAKGGYFLWIQLPSTINAAHFKIFAEKEFKLTFVLGCKFSLTNKYNNYIRISISFYPEDVLLAAISEICTAIREFKQRLAENSSLWKKYMD